MKRIHSTRGVNRAKRFFPRSGLPKDTQSEKVSCSGARKSATKLRFLKSIKWSGSRFLLSLHSPQTSSRNRVRWTDVDDR